VLELSTELSTELTDVASPEFKELDTRLDIG
jgi:hypothetical protein